MLQFRERYSWFIISLSHFKYLLLFWFLFFAVTVMAMKNCCHHPHDCLKVAYVEEGNGMKLQGTGLGPIPIVKEDSVHHILTPTGWSWNPAWGNKGRRREKGKTYVEKSCSQVGCLNSDRMVLTTQQPRTLSITQGRRGRLVSERGSCRPAVPGCKHVGRGVSVAGFCTCTSIICKHSYFPVLSKFTFAQKKSLLSLWASPQWDGKHVAKFPCI